MGKARRSVLDEGVSLSALDMFANAVGALAFLLLTFVVTTIELVRPTRLEILTTDLPSAKAGQMYDIRLAASGGAPPLRWSRTAGLPAGLSLDEQSGMLTGAADAGAAGQRFKFDVTVRDSREQQASASLTLEVLSPEPLTAADPDPAAPIPAEDEPLVLLTSGELPPAVVGRDYRLNLAARGGSGRYRWSAADPPAGFKLTDTGLLQVMASAPGVYQLALTVEDGNRAARGAATLSVARAPVSVRERLLRRGIWPWIGYVVLALVLVGYQYFASRWMNREVRRLLAAHNVDLIQKSDGTYGLNGAPADCEEFNRIHREFNSSQKRWRDLVRAVVALAAVLFTGWLLY